jgi:hypothetical protein
MEYTGWCQNGADQPWVAESFSRPTSIGTRAITAVTVYICEHDRADGGGRTMPPPPMARNDSTAHGAQ